MDTLENVNPKLYEKCEERRVTEEEEDENIVDEYDAREVFGILSIIYTYSKIKWPCW
jgi:hypothetical protein